MTGWDALLRDLETEFAGALDAELDAEVAERTRYEIGRISIADRLGGTAGRELSLFVSGFGRLQAKVTAVGTDWLLVYETAGQSIVALGSVIAIEDLGEQARGEERGSRVNLRLLLRRLARDRERVDVWSRSGSNFVGVLDRTGLDHFDVALELEGRKRRVVTMPIGELAMVRQAR